MLALVAELGFILQYLLAKGLARCFRTSWSMVELSREKHSPTKCIRLLTLLRVRLSCPTLHFPPAHTRPAYCSRHTPKERVPESLGLSSREAAAFPPLVPSIPALRARSPQHGFERFWRDPSVERCGCCRRCSPTGPEQLRPQFFRPSPPHPQAHEASAEKMIFERSRRRLSRAVHLEFDRRNCLRDSMKTSVNRDLATKRK